MKPTMPMNAYPPGGPPGTPPPGGQPPGGGWGTPPPGGFGPPPGGPPHAAPPPKKDNTMLYVGIGCGCLSILACMIFVPLGYVIMERQGGGGLEPVNMTVNGELTDQDPRVVADNSPYDEYTVEVGANWTITADMQSTAFDTYLWLLDSAGNAVVQDDDGGEGLNSRYTYTAVTAGTYTIRANSYSESGRGPYTLTYTTTAPP